MNKLISVVVPVYNVEEYLNRCVKSICKNSYKNIEIILVDDGSTDKSGIICDLLKKEDNRIIVIHKENGGLSSARNSALKIVHGDYIYFVDSDDYIEKDTLLEMLNYATKTDADIIQCGYAREVVGGKNTLFSPNYQLFEDKLTIAKEILIQNKIIVNAWNKLYKKEVIEGVFFCDGKNNEDNLFFTDLLNHINSLVVIPNVYYHYIIRENSITQAKNTVKKVNDWYYAQNYMSHEIVKKYSELRLYADFASCKSMFYILLLFDNKKEPSKELYNVIYSEFKEKMSQIKKDDTFKRQKNIDKIRLLLLYNFGYLFIKVYKRVSK